MAPSGHTGADGLIAGSTQEAGHTCRRSQKPVGRDPRSFPPASRGRAPWGLKAARLCAVQGALPRQRKHELISRSGDISRNRFGFGSVSIRNRRDGWWGGAGQDHQRAVQSRVEPALGTLEIQGVRGTGHTAMGALVQPHPTARAHRVHPAGRS
jgi:hypothetical protein